MSEAIQTTKFNNEQFFKWLCSETYHYCSCDEEKTCYLWKFTNSLREYYYMVDKYEHSDSRENYCHLKQQKEWIDVWIHFGKTFQLFKIPWFNSIQNAVKFRPGFRYYFNTWKCFLSKKVTFAQVSFVFPVSIWI